MLSGCALRTLVSTWQGSTNGGWPSINSEVSASLVSGCFRFTSFIVPWDKRSTPLLPCWSKSLIAAFIFSSSKSLAKILGNLYLFKPLRFIGNLAWIVLASRSNSSNLPNSHCTKRLDKHWGCSFAVDLNVGFWRSRADITMRTFRAISFNSIGSKTQSTLLFLK